MIGAEGQTPQTQTMREGLIAKCSLDMKESHFTQFSSGYNEVLDTGDIIGEIIGKFSAAPSVNPWQTCCLILFGLQ